MHPATFRMMTMHVLSAGDGYTYYTSEVATGDAKRDRDRELGDYYTVDGNPPGRWMGRGADLMGVSGTVTEEQMKALYGEGLHPDADRIIADALAEGVSAKEAQQRAKLGRSYYAYRAGPATLQGRIQAGYDTFQRLNGHEADAEERRLIRAREGAQAFRDAKGREPADKEELGKFITAATRPDQAAVAGFDLVCSPSKSVSVLWALGDTETRKAIEAAQEQAVRDTIGYLEREAIATRAGTNGVAQIEVEGGIAATVFRHYDSRNGDPQLHDHVVVANKVKGVDGKWRTIDSKLLHRMNVPASEFYNAAVMSEVSRRLGVTTTARVPSPGKRPVMEIAGVDPDLIDTFSSRSASIRAATARLTEEYQRDHGRAPDAKALIAIAQQATLETRPQKDHVRSPQAIHEAAVARVGADRAAGLVDVARALAPAGQAVTAVDVDVDEVTALVLRTVEEHHAVWGAHVIEAEARRHLAARIPDQSVAEPLVQQVTRAALGESVTLTPPSPHGAFTPLTRSDGSSIYEHKGKTLFTSMRILDAEDQLLDAARTRTVSPISRDTFERTAAQHSGPLDAGQRDLAREFATSDRELVVGIGPAGAGKTTALRLAATALEDGGRRMIGLAPSAPAASVIAEAVGIEATTIHGFLTAHAQAELPAKYEIRAGDVLVVDEAGMAGTQRLAALHTIAREYGAHVRLIGDDRQLSAVEAGGALRLIDREVGSVRLEHVHRFQDADEAEASLHLRDPLRPGDPFTWYQANDRVIGGDVDRMTDAVFAGWQTDTDAGLRSLMLAPTGATVTELNARAQAHRIAAGTVTGTRSVDLRDGLSAHVGDVIATRRNESLLRIQNGRDRVKNGDLWQVTRIGADGSLDVVHRDHAAPVTLPAGYVREHVELGYARTISRSQGLTADTSHVLGDESMTRETAYTGLTRGKQSNRLYLDVADGAAVDDALEQIAARSDAMLSAHETIRAEQDRVDDLVTLIDQHADVVERAGEIRYGRIAEVALGTDLATTLQSQESWGAVAAALRHAEDYGFSPVETLRVAYEQRELGTADDVPAVLSWRIERALEKIDAPRRSVMDLPDVDGVAAWIADARLQDNDLVPEDWREHLQERHHYIGVRLKERGATLAAERPAWTDALGAVPSHPKRMVAWHQLAAEVDVLRAKYRVDPTEPVAIPTTLRGNEIADRLQQRVTAMHKAFPLLSAEPIALDTRQRYAAHFTNRVDAVRATLGWPVVLSAVAASAAATEPAAEAIPPTPVVETAPAAMPGTETTPMAAVSPTTGQEGIPMSDPLDEALEHVGRHVSRVGQTVTSEVTRQIQRAADERRREQQEAQRKAERDREYAVREAQRRADREREKAEQVAEREQERADRLAARYGRPEAEQQEAAGVADGAAPGAAAASSTETEADTAALTSEERDATVAEAGTEVPDSDAQSENAAYTGRELEEREMLRAAGIDPDERSSGTSSTTSWADQPSMPEISRGDDGMER
ncbi:relaxase domain-containing protein (plasmid) [Clavibacter capsici]|uniref:Relaxase domain-containing protein n=2 Tax=Clavibacter capsici TaxID=1874630 RepID=A0AAE7CEE1_9MICO|nr:relaxase domain-containing protein [Clavibacter capsici]QIS46530.1 relaxase domain-containing protein [Clavibacter capsici]